MKKFSIFAISALLLVAFSVPAMAKVNLSGAMWVTYWAQQESNNLTYEASDGASTWNQIATGAGALESALGGYNKIANRKTFILGQNQTGGSVQALAANQGGFLLAADCPVNDWIKGYAELNANSAALQLAVREAWIELAFMKEIGLRAGVQEVPFGREHVVRPDAGVEEVFISEGSQDVNAILATQADAGMQLAGTVGSGLIGGGVGAIDYALYLGNGTINNVAVAGRTATVLNTADTVFTVNGGSAAVDNNDAKQFGFNLTIKPIQGLYVGGAFFAGDYNNGQTTNGRAKFTAWDVNAGYDVANVLLLSAEYARASHADALGAFSLGDQPTTQGYMAAEEAEWIIKAIYDGIQDWELGVRYAVVDPKNIESEIAAGYAQEQKLTAGVEYKIARGACLKAEYSMVDNSMEHLSKLNAAAAGAGIVRLNPAVDPDDDIFALQLGLQF